MWTELRPGSPGHAEACFTWLSVGLAALVTGVALAAGLWLLKQKNWRGAGGCLVFGLFGGLLFVPSMALDRVRMTPNSVWQQTGLFWSPRVKGFDLEKGDSVAIISVERTNNRGRKRTVTAILVKRASGASQVLEPGDLWSAQLKAMVDCLKVGGFTVEDRRSGAARLYSPDGAALPGNKK